MPNLTEEKIQEMLNNAVAQAMKSACKNCEDMAEKAAEKAVNKVGSKVGVDFTNEEEVHELKGTYLFGLKQKRTSDKINDAAVRASVGVLSIAVLGMLMTGFVKAIGK